MVQYYLQQLQQGAYPSFKLDFELEDQFDAAVFPQIYEVLLNGLPVVLDDNGRLDGWMDGRISTSSAKTPGTA